MIDAKFYSSLNQDIVNIRTAVFIEEQGFKDEFDDIDSNALHVVLFSDGTPCATGRLFPANCNACSNCDDESKGLYKIGRVAVLKAYRGQNLGSAVISALEEKCRQIGGKAILLSAQCRARSFYEKLGYSPFGAEFLEEYCPHINMTKNI